MSETTQADPFFGNLSEYTPFASIISEYYEKAQALVDGAGLKVATKIVHGLNVVDATLTFDKNVAAGNGVVVSVLAAGAAVYSGHVASGVAARQIATTGLGLVVTPEPGTTVVGLGLIAVSPVIYVTGGAVVGNFINDAVISIGGIIDDKADVRLPDQKTVVESIDGNHKAEISQEKVRVSTKDSSATTRGVLEGMDASGQIPNVSSPQYMVHFQS